MVDRGSLNQLIERLQRLHLEQGRILQALESIGGDNIDPPVDSVVSSTDNVVVVEPLPSSTDNVVVVEPLPGTVPVPTVAAFHVGQRVYITNRISHVLVRRATEGDRTAIVTHFTASRVAIRTINGYNTHQHPKNLRPL